MSPKQLYVGVVRAVRRLAAAVGLLDRLERSDRPTLRYLRTLFAVYDAEELAALDVPWWSYGSIAEVDRFLAARPDARVFEYGAGASTAWLARRAAEVVSVEHDEGFVHVARRIAAAFDNVELGLVPPVRPDVGPPRVRSLRPGYQGLDFSDYVDALERADGPFDLIVIDGRARMSCLERAVDHLAEGGMIVVDDVERRRYAAARDVPGFDTRVHRGLTPAMPVPSSTALLRRRPT